MNLDSGGASWWEEKGRVGRGECKEEGKTGEKGKWQERIDEGKGREKMEIEGSSLLLGPSSQNPRSTAV